MTKIGKRDNPASSVTRILLILFATGWAANHFAAMLAVLIGGGRLTTTQAQGAFGVYAVGLLPGLLGGGGASDRFGRAPVVLSGASVAAMGNGLMACWHDTTGVFVGRLIVGAGVGLAVGAGTAWTADLRGKPGTTLAGVALTAGFAAGPLASGWIASTWVTASAWLPFVVSAALSVIAVLIGTQRTRRDGGPGASGSPVVQQRTDNAGVALRAAVPMAMWVFSCATVGFVTLAARMEGRPGGDPRVAGVAAAITLGSGIVVQFAARHRDWGPGCGIVGAGLAAVGLTLAAEAGPAPTWPTFVVACAVLGSAYGLCLREGLIDIETLSPRRHRGLATGVFYACTYLGFALPVTLVVLQPVVGMTVPLLVLAALAAGTAAVRLAQVRSGVFRLRSV